MELGWPYLPCAFGFDMVVDGTANRDEDDGRFRCVLRNLAEDCYR